jgi:hypothetical protein
MITHSGYNLGIFQLDSMRHLANIEVGIWRNSEENLCHMGPVPVDILSSLLQERLDSPEWVSLLSLGFDSFSECPEAGLTLVQASVQDCDLNLRLISENMCICISEGVKQAKILQSEFNARRDISLRVMGMFNKE